MSVWYELPMCPRLSKCPQGADLSLSEPYRTLCDPASAFLVTAPPTTFLTCISLQRLWVSRFLFFRVPLQTHFLPWGLVLWFSLPGMTCHPRFLQLTPYRSHLSSDVTSSEWPPCWSPSDSSVTPTPSRPPSRTSHCFIFYMSVSNTPGYLTCLFIYLFIEPAGIMILKKKKKDRLSSQTTSVQIPALLLPDSVTVGRSLHLFVLSFLICKMGKLGIGLIIAPHRGDFRVKYITVGKVFRTNIYKVFGTMPGT